MAEQDNPTAVVNGQVVEKKSKHNIPKRKIGLGLVFVLALLGLVWLFWQIKTNDSDKVNAPKCSTAILKDADASLQNGKIEDLQKVADKIKDIKNYDKDSNCLYIVASYYVNVSDYGNANSSLKTLRILDPEGANIHVSDVYVGKIALDRLSSEVKFLEKQRDNTQGGAIPSGGAPH